MLFQRAGAILTRMMMEWFHLMSYFHGFYLLTEFCQEKTVVLTVVQTEVQREFQQNPHKRKSNNSLRNQKSQSNSMMSLSKNVRLSTAPTIMITVATLKWLKWGLSHFIWWKSLDQQNLLMSKHFRMVLSRLTKMEMVKLLLKSLLNGTCQFIRTLHVRNALKTSKSQKKSAIKL